MIVGTAGHIDHGKTTLVRALTGVDTDRLPEEKQRGISIELGYAFMDAGPEAGVDAGADAARIGFIDVPGHERLVHTMLAGATGIDFALLLVAADDGPMPQTREHLAVLSLLGLQRGAVVITKADRVDAARLQAVHAEAQALLQGSTLEGSPVLTVAAPSGLGIEALRTLLRQEAAAHAASRAQHDDSAAFRLAIDRAFTLDGVGTVVTGTTHAGRVAAGDELRLVPAPGGGSGADDPVRVRSLHAQNRAVTLAGAGQRCAVALAGVAKERVQRGQWLVAPAAALATQRIDVQLRLWHAETRVLRSGTPVHVHLGSAAVMGSVAVLDGDSLAPGASARVQLVLQAPVGAWHGDRVVLRDASASRTLAGGVVLDPMAPIRYRRTPQRLAELDALAAPDAEERLRGLLAHSPQGVDLQRFAAAQGRRVEVAPATGALRHTDARSDWALGPAHADTAREKVLAALSAFHEKAPEELGPDAARLRRLALPRLPEPLWRALLADLQARGQVALRGAFVHLPAHGVRLSATEERLAQKLAPRLAAVGFEGAWVRDLAKEIGEPEPLLRVTMARLAQRAELHQVVKDLYLTPETLTRAVGLVQAIAQANGGEVTAALFRDATQLGRKRAIQILEYLDRIGLLRRVGDVHRLRLDSALLEKAAGP
jgi:selenocysteine-specific elongation factor